MRDWMDDSRREGGRKRGTEREREEGEERERERRRREGCQGMKIEWE